MLRFRLLQNLSNRFSLIPDEEQNNQISQMQTQLLDCSVKIQFTFNKNILNSPTVYVRIGLGAEIPIILNLIGDYQSTQQVANAMVKQILQQNAINLTLDDDCVLYQDSVVLSHPQPFSFRCDDSRFSKILGLVKGERVDGIADGGMFYATFPKKMSYLGFNDLIIQCQQILQSTLYDQTKGSQFYMLDVPASFQAGSYVQSSDGSQFKMTKSQLQQGFTIQLQDEDCNNDIQFMQEGTYMLFDLTFSENQQELQQKNDTEQKVQGQIQAKQQAEQDLQQQQIDAQNEQERKVQQEKMIFLLEQLVKKEDKHFYQQLHQNMGGEAKKFKDMDEHVDQVMEHLANQIPQQGPANALAP